MYSEFIRSQLILTSAICLSSLRAPSPPEPAKLSGEKGVIDEATIAPMKSELAPEEVFRLRECGHEFHSDCLISWTMLHKKSCPICRTVYYHEEPEKGTDIEEQMPSVNQSSTTTEQPTPPNASSVTNWHYFWTGHSVRHSNAEPQQRSGWWRFRRP